MYKQIFVIALALVTFAACSPKPSADSAALIPKDSANKMIQSYLNSLDSNDGNQLHSLIIDAGALRNYLNSETGCKMTSVKIMFAHQLNYINEGNSNVYCGYDKNALTVILAGYDEDNNYVYYENKVLDHTRPCPSECPSSGSASNSLLE